MVVMVLRQIAAFGVMGPASRLSTLSLERPVSAGDVMPNWFRVVPPAHSYQVAFGRGTAIEKMIDEAEESAVWLQNRQNPMCRKKLLERSVPRQSFEARGAFFTPNGPSKEKSRVP